RGRPQVGEGRRAAPLGTCAPSSSWRGQGCRSTWVARRRPASPPAPPFVPWLRSIGRYRVEIGGGVACHRGPGPRRNRTGLLDGGPPRPLRRRAREPETADPRAWPAFTVGLLMLLVVGTAQVAIFLNYRSSLDLATREGAFQAS